MLPPGPILPVLERRADIEAAIRAHQVVVLCGATGSGKTTQLPQICFDMGLARTGLIGHTQPRRLAARAVAARIAEERSDRVGGLVGYKVRFEDRTSRDTRIKVMTDGTLLAELVADRALRAYSTLIIDEAHERSLNIDFLLGYLRRLLPERKDLKVIITSATIDPRRFSDAFGGPAVAPVIEVSGRTYPVEVRYRPARDDEEDHPLDTEAVADAVDDLVRPGTPEGDVLVFLPGEREIRQADVAIKRRAIDADVLPLFSRLSNQEQDRIFHPGPRRRVILATNVAETSLTVPRIVYVVDTGLARMARYDPRAKVQRLPIEPISRASADQRAGRCGRIASGVCVRLYSEDSYRKRPLFTDPEIRRTSLASIILQMKTLDLGPIEAFPFLDPPDAHGIRDGYETLFELGAIMEANPAGALTDIGVAIARIPAEPRIGRMLLAAEREGSLRETLVLAAALSIQDPRERPMGRQEDADRAQAVFRNDASDFLTLLNVWTQYVHAADTMPQGRSFAWCREHFLSAARMREWTEMASQLGRIVEDMNLQVNDRPAAPDAIHRALLTGLISNVACREAEGGSFDYRSVRAGVAQIFPGSVLFKKGPKWIMAGEMVETTRLYARTVARAEPAWLEELAGHMFRRQLTDQHLDVESGEPSAWERVTMAGIVVVPRRRAAIAAFDHSAARSIFLRDALAACKWRTDAPFMVHNTGTLAAAARAEAKLRRRGVLADTETIAAWFDALLPPEVCDPATLNEWRQGAEAIDPRVLFLPPDGALKPEARAALRSDAFPDSIVITSGDGPMACALDYALAPGKDEDGVTVTLPLTALPALTDDRALWLVPGFLPDLVQSLVKTLPKPERASLEAKSPAATTANAIAGVLTFAAGPLPAALSEAAEVLYGVSIPIASWSFKALPAHLRLRVRVTDDRGKELGIDRDLVALRTRFEARLRKLQAGSARARFERTGLTAWTFGMLPESLPPDDAAPGAPRFPAIVDDGDSVSLTLLSTESEAAAYTALGLRRLFAIACRDEIEPTIAAFADTSELTRQYSQLGPADDLRRALAALVAEKTFLIGQRPVRSADDFESRLTEHRGRIAGAAREVADAVARTLEARARVAHRLAGGTPRLWAASIADIREHAAYLMPRGFLGVLPWERARAYPLYAESMRARLFALREEGSRAETDSLQRFAPYWKRFTGLIASGMSVERDALAAAGDQTAIGVTRHTGKAALPQARRRAQAVNVDAGEWAMQPGCLEPAIERYRWALEDARITLFTPDLASPRPTSLAELERLWDKVRAEDAASARR